jgi:Glycosyltransferase family 28 C-terminal domain
MYQDLLDSAQDADMIMAGGVVFAAPLVADKLGIPLAISAPQPVAFLSAYDPAVIPFLPFLYKLRGLGLTFNRSVRQLLKVVAKSWAAPLHQFRKELKLPPVDDPLMIMTSGSFYQESIRATKLLKWRAVLLIGNNPPPADLLAEIIAVGYVPYSQIFPRACAIVHQGGIGTTAQAMRSGRPTLIMPYSHDQPDNAARVERLGTSRTIPRKHYVATRVAKELQELLEDSSYAAKAAEIGVVLQSENGVGMACDKIIQISQQKSKD